MTMNFFDLNSFLIFARALFFSISLIFKKVLGISSPFLHIFSYAIMIHSWNRKAIFEPVDIEEKQ